MANKATQPGSRNCTKCTHPFEITREDLNFYEKIQVPEPKTCPTCRMQLRFTARNTRKLYYRKCDYSGEKIISQYHPDTKFPVYKPEYWWSDKWDGRDFGQNYDPSKPFFEQILELNNKVPHQSVFVISGTSENSDYTNCTGYLKNCYLIFESDHNENCMYSNLLKNSRSILDSSFCYDSELCYECIDCLNCYNLKYSKDCTNCSDSWLLQDCSDCSDCIGCINQRHKKYMIFNVQYSKEEYEKLKPTIPLDKFSGINKVTSECKKFFQSQPHRNVFIEQTENCSGDHLLKSKNAHQCFDSKDLEDCRYCQRLSLNVKDCMDYNSWGDRAELIYQSSACGDNIYNLKFCATCTTNVSNLEYSIECARSKNLFGCVGLIGREYCILNKQYTKEEYEKLVPRIIADMKKRGEYGEFFPAKVLAFGYNETIAMEQFPLTKEEALKQGFHWRDDQNEINYSGPKVVIPETINEDDEKFIDQILTCEECAKNYKIIHSEFEFYQKNGIPIPHFCPDCRSKKRLSKRNKYQMFARNCANCKAQIKSTYAPNSPEKVYCEKCYLNEVY